MKNKFLTIISTTIFLFISEQILFAKNLNIKSSTISIDKKKNESLFKGNVIATDLMNNILEADEAQYNKKKEKLTTIGATTITTSEDYKIFSSDVIFDNVKGIISSDYSSIIEDKEGNKIFVDMFNYDRKINMFFSKGKIKVIDINNNTFNFSEIYIDEKKQKIAGSDARVFLSQNSLKINKENNPRLFSNNISISENVSTLNKGIFTYCKFRENGKCPPWSLQADKIYHDQDSKTIYYDNAILKIYDFPIFYTPKFSHPDPTVKRRSGFLVPSITNSSNMGAGLITPYFWNIANDKDITFTPKYFNKGHPLLLAEYRQDFKDSFLIVDSGYTKGYKKNTLKKSKGSQNHLFAKLNIDFFLDKEKENNLELNIQRMNNRSYTKIYDIKTSLLGNEVETLENSLDYTLELENSFIGMSAAAFEDLSKSGNNKYEYLAPSINFEKNLLLSEKYGFYDFSSNFEIRNYDVNKQTEFFVNDINWKSSKSVSKYGLESEFKGLIKSVNYQAANTSEYKNKQNNHEAFGALGYLLKFPFFKNDITNKDYHIFTPKMLIRYAPGSMRNSEDVLKLNYTNIFSLNKLNSINHIDPGLSSTIGFQYENKEINSKGEIGNSNFSFSAGQVIAEKENLDRPQPLDQRFSDVVGKANWKVNDFISLNNKYSIDQSYKNFNYNEVGVDYEMGKVNFNISYLEEKEHLGSQEYIKTNFGISPNDSTKLSFSSKRNILRDSSEFYDLSYEYLNDCLRAGIIYRREFYTDRDIEPDNSLMFTITVLPFGQTNSPNVKKWK